MRNSRLGLHVGVVLLGGCLIDRSAVGGSPDELDAGMPADAFLVPGADAPGLDAHRDMVDAFEVEPLDAPDRLEPDVPIAPIADAWLPTTPDAWSCLSSGVELCNARDDNCNGAIDESGCAMTVAPGISGSCTGFTHAGHVYQICTASLALPWEGAVMACALFPPYVLARIDDPPENSEIARHVVEDAWIDASDRLTEGAFAWTNAMPVPFTSWAAMEPTSERGSSGAEEDCVSMRGLNWQDRYCGSFTLPTDVSVRAFVCEATIVR